MSIDQSRPGPTGEDRAGSGLGRIMSRFRRSGPPERMRILAVGGRTLRVSVRDGAPGWPPLLLCNGIGGHLELAADSGRLASAVEAFLNAEGEA